MKQSRLLIPIILLLAIYWIINTLYSAGVFNSISNYSIGYKTEVLETPPGIEDLDYDQESGTVFMSSTDRRNRSATGNIYSFNVNSNTFQPVNLTGHLDIKEFRPHGISFINSNGQKFLFAISHKDKKNVVIKFLFENDSLKLKEIYSSSDFSSPNDIAATGENSFFITNDHGDKTGLVKTLSDFLRIPVGNVVHFDNGNSTVVLDKISYPNGILVLNEDVYVSSTLGNYIGIYQPKSSFLHLEETGRIKVPYSPDNLMALGNKIYVGAHPKLFRFVSHSKSADKISPSSVFSVENGVVEKIWMDDGKLLSGSSTALPLINSEGKRQIYIGSVFESKVLKLTAE